MRRFGFVFALIFLLDQGVKFWFYRYCEGIEGSVVWESVALSLVLVLNKGVAFSFLSFMGVWLKYLQILALVGVSYLLYRQREYFLQNRLAFGLIFAGGCSNILDRFTYGGVVDYIYWHYYFNFAVFNFADVMIDLGGGLLLYQIFRGYASQRAISSARK